MQPYITSKISGIQIILIKLVNYLWTAWIQSYERNNFNQI